jgi:DNA-binding MarR family transcriptional regulator
MASQGNREAELRLPPLNKLIHERARLMILAYLASSPSTAVGFTELQEKLELSAGNLSIQLRNLQEAGYVEVSKRFERNRPRTSVALTALGSKALARYLTAMEGLIRGLRSKDERRSGKRRVSRG